MTVPERRSIRRLTPVPAPHTYETLGSWIDRLARGQHVTRDEFVRALCAELDIERTNWDIDTDAPQEFLARLASRTGLRILALRRLTVPGGAPLTAGEGEPYCPVCWVDPTMRYVRRSWRARWSTACDRHNVLLKAMQSPAPLGDGGGLASVRTSRVDDLPIEMGWMIQSGAALITEFESTAPDERTVRDGDRQRLERARVLRDLALIAGTHFAGGSLVELTLPIRRGPTSTKGLHWCDRGGRAMPVNEVDAPMGPLTLRQQALRVAWLLWLRAYGWRYFEEARDVTMLAIVTLADCDVDVSRAIAVRVRHWPASVRERWSAAYETPAVAPEGRVGIQSRSWGVSISHCGVASTTLAPSTE